MAGRSRGRGRRMMTFSVEAIGINRGDSLPPSVQQPTPLFPVMEQKPLPLTGGEEVEYLLALKQEFRGAMRSQPGFIQPAAARRDVERYSDKYHSSEPTEEETLWSPDWSRFPKELRVKKPARHIVSVSRSVKLQSTQKKKNVKEKEEVLLKLESLEKKEERGSEEEEEEQGEEKKKKQEEEEAEGEEEYDEEEFEEETDYVMSYFDNGEEFGGDSDENMDEAVY